MSKKPNQNKLCLAFLHLSIYTHESKNITWYNNLNLYYITS